MKSNIVTRFAPSPTGYFHVGGARSALFNYLFSRAAGGKFILRIEDTDRERNQPEYEADILDSFKWLGFDYDELYRQSERTAIYRQHLEQLIAENKIYISKEEPKNEGDRSEVIRFRNPGKKVAFNDIIRGPVEMDTSDLGDFVIAKDLDTPIFHFTNVVDDWTMGITHVIRGEEHLSNTPRQLLIYEALGATPPEFAHIPLILDENRAKLSKRKHGAAVWLRTYQEEGYLPEAMNNFLALLGWSPQAESHGEAGTNEEIFSLAELKQKFDLSKVQKNGAIFNISKLKWLNREHLKRKSSAELMTLVTSFLPAEITTLPQYSEDRLRRTIPVIMERITTLHDLAKMAQTADLQYFFDLPTYDKSLLRTVEHLNETIKKLENIDENVFTAENVKNAIWDFATEKGRGEVLWPMRVALSGKEKSPDPFTLAALFGKKETLLRLSRAVNIGSATS